MKNPSSEPIVFALLALVSVAAFLLPSVVQPEHYHDFADHRMWLGIPNFADVATNIVFSVIGVLGLCRLRHVLSLPCVTRLSLATFFVGLFLTSAGSAFYHWAPTSETLLWDRLPMVIAFTGVIGAFLAQRISARAAYAGILTSVLLGGSGLWMSTTTGNITPYLMLQFGGLLGIVAGLLLTNNPRDAFPWWAVIGWYAVAKALELGDQHIWEFTGHLVSGHPLKHIAAGMAGWAIAKALRTPKGSTGRAGEGSPVPAH